MELYKSDFIVISIDQVNLIISFKWTIETHTERFNDELFRNTLLLEVKYVQEYKPKSIVIDTSDFGFTIAPTTQSWIDKNIYPKWAQAGVTKIALLISKVIFSQVSIEQAIDEYSSNEMISNFFETENEALDWLKN